MSAPSRLSEPTPFDQALLESALALAEAAGAVLLGGVGSTHASESKSTSADLVTAYDRAAEEVILRGIRERHPGHRILAEESGSWDGDAAAPCWIVDPLDGTTNFAHGLPLFSVSIAVAVGEEVRAGVVYAPALSLCFSAVRGGGARRNGQPIRVSSTDSLEQAMLATGFPYDRRTATDNNFAQFVAFKRRAQGIRRFGSAALDLSFLACGSFDGYWEMKLKPWDVAAGLLLVEEAGGKLSDWSGNPVSLARGEVLASNGPLHPAMQSLLARIRPGDFSV